MPALRKSRRERSFMRDLREAAFWGRLWEW
jgi:hypothetical protein